MLEKLLIVTADPDPSGWTSLPAQRGIKASVVARKITTATAPDRGRAKNNYNHRE
jgi:hypothetical protein